jgi:hypothetical protein
MEKGIQSDQIDQNHLFILCYTRLRGKKHFCASNKRFLINIYTCPCASNIKYERRRKTRKKPGEKIIFEKIFKRENKIPPAKAACKG